MQKPEIKHIISPDGGQRLPAGLQRIGNCYSRTNMASRNRSVTVLFSLIASMTVGALVLMALDGPVPTTGPFSLSSYIRLNAAQDVVNTVSKKMDTWSAIDIYYSRTSGGSADELALLTDLATGTKSQFHFAIGDGEGEDDGAIRAGEHWKLQKLCQGQSGVVRICVISEGRPGSTTDSQLKRTSALVESLIRTFDISPRNIRYPANWQM